MSSRGPWRALLTGRTRERALAAVQALMAPVKSVALSPAAETDLANGRTGYALFFEYAARQQGNAELHQLAQQTLELAVEAQSEPTSSSLFHGVVGTAFAVEHLYNDPAENDGDDLNGSTDVAVEELLEAPLGNFDLVHGRAGVGIYARERLRRVGASTLLDAVLEQLGHHAQRDGQGARFWTATEHATPNGLEFAPRGYYDLGIAHGISGLLLLASAAATPPAWLAQGVEWLLRQERPGSVFRYGSVGEPGRYSESRLAWCYGDLGVALTLVRAGEALDAAELIAHGQKLAHHAAAVPPKATRVTDAGLCHGAAGVAHLFNRLAQELDDSLLEAAARTWLERTLAFAPPDVQGDLGFLTGASGAGLALLAAASDVEPGWDRVLLVS